MLSPLSVSGGPTVEVQSLEDGQMFGPYRIIRLLGRGGVGEVYEAEHGETGRRVALKRLRGRIDLQEDLDRFLREGQLAASISDPHTVYVFGSHEIDGMPVIVMQLVPGGTLKDRVADAGPMSVQEAVSAILDVISGLDAAASAGILHRDIKPSNCFVDADGTVKVGDFGLSIPTSGRSGDGTFLGTPQYAPPEQLRGAALDSRADIYAVGATLYYLLTGAPPFESKDFGTLIDRVKNEPPPLAHKVRSGVPAALGALIARCLAKEAADRPATYTELARALRPFSATGVPARLDVRLLAGIIDYLLLSIPAGILNNLYGFGVARRGNTSVDIEPWTFVVAVTYFALCEARWATTPGKRLLGLFVTSQSGAISWRQAFLRAFTYSSPALVTLAPTLVMGREGFTQFVLSSPWLVGSAAFVQIGFTLLLFSTMRTRNGYAAVHDLVSKTRVVRRSSRVLRLRGAHSPSENVTAESGAIDSERRLGSFVVGRELASFEGARLVEGIDAVLKRTVWLVEQNDGTPETPKARRDVGRPARLHWLAGQRSDGENWDAFEAPPGQPFTTATRARWPIVHGWLNDLIAELTAGERDDTVPVLAGNRLWIRPDNRAVLLDIPAPGTDASSDPLTPQQLLSMVGQAALSDASPMPASAVAMLDRWSSKRSISVADMAGDMAVVTSVADQVSRRRRAGPLLLAASPVMLMLLAAFIAIQTSGPPPTHDRFVTSELLERLEDERDPVRQQALKVYLAGRFKAELTSADAHWRVADQTDDDIIRTRGLADASAALTPSPDEVARAAVLLDRELARAELDFMQNNNNPRTIFIALLLTGASMSLLGGLISVAVRPSGFVLSSMGMAVINSRGREIGRARAIARQLLIWSPLLVYGALLAWPVTRPSVASIAVASIAAAPIGIGFVWSLFRPARGPHDIIIGTSIGVR